MNISNIKALVASLLTFIIRNILTI